MSLYQKIVGDLSQAMKARDKLRVAVLRMAKAALMNVAIERGAVKDGAKGDDLSDEQVIAVLQKEAKKREEASVAFTAGGRPELAQKEQKELAVLRDYLPQQLTEQEIKDIVKKIIAAAAAREFKVIMPQAMVAMKGRADGKKVQQIVREILT